MAEKRMFSLQIVDSDAFLEMPQSTQNLYFHLSMRADDDGFVNKPRSIMKQIGSQDDDITLLITKKFIIPFESGIVVIKHWKIHNYIAKDRYKETKYKEEKTLLSLDENNSYTLNKPCIQNVYVDKNRLDKIRLDKNIEKPNLEEIENYIKEKGLKVSGKEFYNYFETGNWVDSKGNKVKNWKQKLLTWNSYKKDEKKTPINNCTKRDYANLNNLYSN